MDQGYELFDDLIGKPFHWGGRGPTAYDCYGLVMECALRDGQLLPDYGSLQSAENINRLIKEFSLQFKPGNGERGDIVLFKLQPPFINHMGYVINNSWFIHVMVKRLVTRERFDNPLWRMTFAGFVRWNG